VETVSKKEDSGWNTFLSFTLFVLVFLVLYFLYDYVFLKIIEEVSFNIQNSYRIP